MGYRKGRKIFVLEFADPEFEGLEVKAHSLPIGELRRLMMLDTDSDNEKGAQATFELIEAFNDALISWNLEDDTGVSVPATLEGIEGQDLDFVMSIIGAWMSTMSSVGDGTPLAEPSTSGRPFPEASIPMEPLSASLAS